jgi:hypothetical protein
MPAAGSFVHLLPEPASSGSRLTNIRVDKFMGRQFFVEPLKLIVVAAPKPIIPHS